MNRPPPSGLRLESWPCPMGCARDDELVLEGFDRLHGLPGRFRVVRCRSCGLLRTDPRPTRDTIGLYYPDEYGPYLGSRVAPPASPGRPRSRARPRILRFRTDALPPLPPGRMLEVGCASGSFLHGMAERGWEVMGVEPSSSAAENVRALGLPVHQGPLETAPPPSEPYDLVVGLMVLEHLHDPVAALRRLREWTRPGGWLVLSVPNAAALEFRIFRDAWYALQLPTHLHHFTPRTLRAMLEHTGWSTDRVMHQRVLSNLFVSLGYRLRDAGFGGPLMRTLLEFPERAARLPLHEILYPAATVLAALGQTGRMTVWARRP